MLTFDIMAIRDDAVVRTNFSQNVSLLCNDLREEIYLALELSVSCFGSVMRRGPGRCLELIPQFNNGTIENLASRIEG